MSAVLLTLTGFYANNAERRREWTVLGGQTREMLLNCKREWIDNVC